MSSLRSKGIHTEKGAFLVWSALSFGGVREGVWGGLDSQAWIDDIARSVGHAYCRIFAREFCA